MDQNFRHVHNPTLNYSIQKTMNNVIPATRIRWNNHGRTCRLRSVDQRNVLVRLQNNQNEKRQLRHKVVPSTSFQNWMRKGSTRTAHSHGPHPIQYWNIHIHGYIRHPVEVVFSYDRAELHEKPPGGNRHSEWNHQFPSRRDDYDRWDKKLQSKTASNNGRRKPNAVASTNNNSECSGNHHQHERRHWCDTITVASRQNGCHHRGPSIGNGS